MAFTMPEVLDGNNQVGFLKIIKLNDNYKLIIKRPKNLAFLKELKI